MQIVLDLDQFVLLEPALVGLLRATLDRKISLSYSVVTRHYLLLIHSSGVY